MEQETTLKRILEILENNEKLKLISTLSVYEISQQQPEKTEEKYDPFKDHPSLPFIIGLSLLKPNSSTDLPQPEDIQKIIDESKNYFDQFITESLFQLEKLQSKEESSILQTRLQNLVGQINPHRYEFQNDDILRSIFGILDDYYKSTYGFTINEALGYGKKIRNHVENCLNQQFDLARKAAALAKTKINDKSQKKNLERFQKETGLSTEDIIQRSYISTFEKK